MPTPTRATACGRRSCGIRRSGGSRSMPVVRQLPARNDRCIRSRSRAQDPLRASRALEALRTTEDRRHARRRHDRASTGFDKPVDDRFAPPRRHRRSVNGSMRRLPQEWSWSRRIDVRTLSLTAHGRDVMAGRVELPESSRPPRSPPCLTGAGLADGGASAIAARFSDGWALTRAANRPVALVV